MPSARSARLEGERHARSRDRERDASQKNDVFVNLSLDIPIAQGMSRAASSAIAPC
jgi:hypothetical protein